MSDAFKTRHKYNPDLHKNQYVFRWLCTSGITILQVSAHLDITPRTFREKFLQKKSEPTLEQALYINYLSNNEVPITSLIVGVWPGILKQLRRNLAESDKDKEILKKHRK